MLFFYFLEDNKCLLWKRSSTARFKGKVNLSKGVNTHENS